MDKKTTTSLTPREEPIQIQIPVGLIIVASIVFAVVFFIVGSIFRHYPNLLGVI